MLVSMTSRTQAARWKPEARRMLAVKAAPFGFDAFIARKRAAGSSARSATPYRPVLKLMHERMDFGRQF